MKTINTNNTAAATTALNLKVNHQTRTIEMNKTFADKASRFGSDEYDALMLAREQNPGYATKVITRKATKSDKPSYKGLTYEYIQGAGEDHLQCSPVSDCRCAGRHWLRVLR